MKLINDILCCSIFSLILISCGPKIEPASPTPNNGALGVSFRDTDTDQNKIAGTVKIAKATDQSDITHYVVYLGANKLAEIPKDATSGKSLTHEIPSGTDLTAGSIIHVRSMNDFGISKKSAKAAVNDTTQALPTMTVNSVAMQDRNVRSGKLGGKLVANYENPWQVSNNTVFDGVNLALYWGVDETTKLSANALIAEVYMDAKGNMAGYNHEELDIPNGATHILAYVRNEYGAAGESATPTAWAITDTSSTDGTPQYPPEDIAFIDSDTTSGKLGGTVRISRAYDESNVTDYVLYFTDSNETKLGSALTTISKAETNLEYSIAEGTAIPNYAEYLTAFTKNASGEIAYGRSALLEDAIGTVPTNKAEEISFYDQDSSFGSIGGEIIITKAESESDLALYLVYWGNSSGVPISSEPLAEIFKTGNDLTCFVPGDTIIPLGATSLVVYTANANGIYQTGASVDLDDYYDFFWTGPVRTAEFVDFHDEDFAQGSVGGYISIYPPEDEEDIDYYSLYWGDETGPHLDQYIDIVFADYDIIDYDLYDDTTIPTGMTRIYALAGNGYNEMYYGPFVDVVDNYMVTYDSDGEVVSSDSSRNRSTAPVPAPRASSTVGGYLHLVNYHATKACPLSSFGLPETVSVSSKSNKNLVPIKPAYKDFRGNRNSNKNGPYPPIRTLVNKINDSTTTHTFYVSTTDDTNATTIQVEATKKYGETDGKCLIFVQNSFLATYSDSDWQTVGSYCDNTVYTYLQTNFGKPADVDENEKVVILYTGLRKNDANQTADQSVIGYFMSADLYDTNNYAYSNQMEILYMNLNWGAPTNATMTGTLGHELEHLINFSQRSWFRQKNANGMHASLDEGMAEAAQYLMTSQYLTDRNTSFNNDSGSNMKIRDGDLGVLLWKGDDRNYFLSYSFVLYSLAQTAMYGEDAEEEEIYRDFVDLTLFKNLLKATKGDHDAYAKVLGSFNEMNGSVSPNFGTLLLNYTMALYYKNARGKYSFRKYADGFSNIQVQTPTKQPAQITLQPTGFVYLPYTTEQLNTIRELGECVDLNSSRRRSGSTKSNVDSGGSRQIRRHLNPRNTSASCDTGYIKCALLYL